jgi:hypothetical protein
VGEAGGLKVVDRIRAFWKWLVQRDHLPAKETDSGRTHRDLPVLTWLTARDTLPRRPTTRSRTPRRLSWLFSNDTLPDLSEREGAETRSSLSWLFRAEKLPAPPIDSASKEAS